MHILRWKGMCAITISHTCHVSCHKFTTAITFFFRSRQNSTVCLNTKGRHLSMKTFSHVTVIERKKVGVGLGRRWPWWWQWGDTLASGVPKHLLYTALLPRNQAISPFLLLTVFSTLLHSCHTHTPRSIHSYCIPTKPRHCSHKTPDGRNTKLNGGKQTMSW